MTFATIDSTVMAGAPEELHRHPRLLPHPVRDSVELLAHFLNPLEAVLSRPGFVYYSAAVAQDV